MKLTNKKTNLYASVLFLSPKTFKWLKNKLNIWINLSHYSFLISSVVQSPKIGRPISMTQSSFKRKQPAQNLLHLEHERAERRGANKKHYKGKLIQPWEVEVVFMEAVSSQEENKIGWRYVHVNVFEVQQNWKPQGSCS